MPIKISIATAVYNLDESFLRKFIEGASGQLTDETELLLIDDCSTNNSGDVCREYAGKDSRIRYIRMEANGGLSCVRNRSIDEAKGKWVFFADGDDLLSLHFVETALRFCDSDADIIIHERMKFVEFVPLDFQCYVEKLTELPAEAGCALSISCLCLDPSVAKPFGLSSRAFYHAAWGALYKKEFLVKHNLRFPVGQKKAQDSVFNTEAYYYAEKIAYLPYIMYYYRNNPRGITRRYSGDLPEINSSLLKLLNEEKEKLYPDDTNVNLRFQNHRIMATVVDNMRLNIFHKNNPKSKNQRREEFLSFIEEEPYKSAIDNFDAFKFNRREWLLTVVLIRKKRFSEMNVIFRNDNYFRFFSGVYKRFSKFIRKRY